MVAASSLYYKDNTYRRQSMCEHTVLRFHISLTEEFSNQIFPRVMKRYDKGAVVKIQAVFWTSLEC